MDSGPTVMVSGARPGPAPKRVSHYALIGDCETAALVSREGCVEWLCWPAFDSEACCASLLGDSTNGCWSLAPIDEVKAITRRYAHDTLVLETRFETPGGSLLLIDFMPPRSEVSRLIRIVRCERGAVQVRSAVALRFEYGRRPPWICSRDEAVVAISGPSGVRLDTDVPVEAKDGACLSEFALAAGETRCFSLAYFESHRPPPPAPDPDRELEGALAWWRGWVARCRYDGAWREMVVRSLITLKALTYRPTGGVLAAPTSSLPERPGGRRNWDYRFCWLRDATFTLLSLLQAGYVEEATAWRDWLLRAVAGQPGDLQPLYTLAGERLIHEWRAEWLGGMSGSRPVRFGNAAADQRQLDAYGEVIDALYQAERFGVRMTVVERQLRTALIDHVARMWREPDSGIWEVRGRSQRFTHSQVMAWAALDRGVRSAAQLGEAPAASWSALRDRMHAEICAGCYDPAQNAFTQAFGSATLDASVLLLPHVGFLAADDPRMTGTVEAIQRRLMWDGFVHRYAPDETDDGLCEGEGAFLPCSFWLTDTLTMQGRQREAEALFDRVLATANDVGLLAEEYDVAHGVQLGNFPQALSHLSLVNSAFGLEGWGAAQERSQKGGDARPRAVATAGHPSGR
jgi:GH15 family glucan-1,4-alpha-glucosidase